MKNQPGLDDVTFRSRVEPTDREAVRAIVDSTAFFSPAEAEVAVELVDEFLFRGEASGYRFIFADGGGRPCGYSCYGPIACTLSSYDLYWIAVLPGFQGKGLGRALVKRTEAAVKDAGGTRIYVETSNRAQYEPTRAFYERCGYDRAAVLSEFYGPGDDKVIYVKAI